MTLHPFGECLDLRHHIQAQVADRLFLRGPLAPTPATLASPGLAAPNQQTQQNLRDIIPLDFPNLSIIVHLVSMSRTQREVLQFRFMKKTSFSLTVVSVILTECLMFLVAGEALAQGSWAKKTSMPTARWASPSGVIGGKFYIAAGYNPALGGHITPVEVYDPATDSWVSKNPKPFSQTGAAAGVVNGLLYVAGGADCCVAIATVDTYNPTSDTWTTLASLPQADEFPAGAVIKGLMYVAGVSNPFATPYSATLDVYDPSSGGWTAKTPMPTPRAVAGACAVNGILYVVGGNDPTGNALSTVEAYDPTTDSWTAKAPMPTPRTGLAVVELNGILYAIGGANTWSDPIVYGNVEAYNPALDVWTTQAPMPTARGSLKALVANGSIYAIGGVAAGGATALAAVEAFTPPPILAIQFYPGLTITAPVGSTNKIQYVNDLNKTNWTTLTNLVLPSDPYIFIDYTSIAHPRRFYRDVLSP